MADRSFLSRLADEAGLAFNNVTDAAAGLAVPSLRLGVTGLARAGKTVFISALVHNLIHGGRLPLFTAAASGRMSNAFLQPQPDDNVPRFDYENHIDALVNDRVWPDSTRQISELRLTIDFESASFMQRSLGRGRLHLDIIDYPGEWLLDLPLLGKDFATFCAESVSRLTATSARGSRRENPAEDYLHLLNTFDPEAPADESLAKKLAMSFTAYLAACRRDEHALSMLPPGRFLMPGDLEGSPALTFAPLTLADPAQTAPSGSLHAMMERRFEAYKTHVVHPFFKNHFARLDRQIVLVDALNALNAGPEALVDLQNALSEIMSAFRPGKRSWLSSILTRRIDRILFAATKADHLHRDDHDRLEAILRELVQSGVERAEFRGANVDVLALAAVRATKEANVTRRSETLPAIMGAPLPGEVVNGERYDGETDIAFFPGDLPDNPKSLFHPKRKTSEKDDPTLKFVRFRPPKLERTAEGVSLSLPHIRLDRALEFLIGDYLA